MRRVAGLVIAIVSVMALAVPAGADTPPGVGTLPDGEWVAFTLSETNLTAPRGSSTWGPVDLIRQGTLTDVEGAFANWEVDPSTGDRFWPSSWSASGFTLERAVPKDQCPALGDRCSYDIVSGGTTFEVNVGTPPPLPATFPDPQSVTLIPPLPAEISIDVNENLSPVKGQNGQPGQITLDASGTTDGTTDPDSLSYAWTVSGNGVTKSAVGKIATVDLDQDGQYDLTLSVTNPVDGHVTTFSGRIAVAGVAPDTPSQNPGNGGGGGGGGVNPAPSPTPPAAGVDPGNLAQSVVFAPSRRTIPPALFGGRNGEAQVVWLWRPEWAGAPTGPRKPRTASPPVVRERDDIVIGASEPTPDSSAAPWLAGLGAFGLFGLGWIITRRRRLRRAEL